MSEDNLWCLLSNHPPFLKQELSPVWSSPVQLGTLTLTIRNSLVSASPVLGLLVDTILNLKKKENQKPCTLGIELRSSLFPSLKVKFTATYERYFRKAEATESPGQEEHQNCRLALRPGDTGSWGGTQEAGRTPSHLTLWGT